MTNRSLIILATIFAILLMVVTESYWSEFVDWRRVLGQNQEPSFEVLGSLDQLDFYRGDDNQLTLRFEGGSWMVEDYLVDSDTISGLLEDLGNLRLSTVVSTNPVNFASYGATDSATRITLHSQDRSQMFYVGIAGLEPGTIYLRPESLPQVYQVTSNLLSYVFLTLDQWRDKTIIDLNRDELARISLTRAGRQVTVEPGEDGVWTASLRSDSRIIGEVARDRLLDELDPLKAVGFGDTRQERLFGSARNTTTIIFTKSDESLITLTLVNDSESGSYLAKVSDNPQLFVVSQSTVNAIVDNTLTIFD